MVDWVGNGGCINGIRYSEEGTGVPNWIADVDVSIAFQPNNKTIIVHVSLDGDDMCTVDGDFFLEYQDVDDADGWNDLGAAGEIRQVLTSSFVDGTATPTNRLNGSFDCSGMGVDPGADGEQREDGNEINLTNATDGEYHGLEWAIDLSFAEAGHEYEFRISEAGGGSNVYKTFLATVDVVQAGKIDLVSRNKDSTVVEGSCTVTAIESDGGSPAKPLIVGGVRSQVVTNGSGVGTITGLISGDDYFLHYVDSTGAIADGTEAITAVAA